LSQQKTSLRGKITDVHTGEPVPGAAVFFESLKKGGAADASGSYSVESITPGTYKVKVSAISYKTLEITDVIIKPGVNTLDIILEEDVNLLNEVVVTSVKRMNSELAVIQATRQADAVVSGISGKAITKAQDRSAAEVVRRIPGVSIVNDRFIMVRGLASRYNNVWVNNAAVPGTETDSRAFSFDMLPGSQIESILIVKSPSAELPADFSGGFVKITTKSMPEENETLLSYGINLNSSTHFNKHFYNTSSPTDFLGFDNGIRSVRSFVGRRLNNGDGTLVTKATAEGFRNDWSVNEQRPAPDQRFGFTINRFGKLRNSAKVAMTAALNYSYGYQTYSNMANSRFGVYNNIADQPEYIYCYTDNQYSVDARVGAMVNFTYLKGNTKYEFRNIFNQIGKNRYTTRSGWQNLSQRYDQEKFEYLYNSRTSYTGQFSGTHNMGESVLDWNAAYSYAGLDQPDRRIINREENQIVGDDHYGEMAIDQNEITRDFVKLHEHTITPAVNFKMPVKLKGDVESEIRAGLYGEFRSREYTNRQFLYRFNQYNLPSDFVYGDVINEILRESNYGSDKLYIYEDTDNRDSYKARNLLGAAYLSYKLPLGRFNILMGARVEASQMTITSFTSIYDFNTSDKVYNRFDLHPSLNASYNLDKKNILRFAFGTSSNKQEFRELSSSVFYDFTLFSDVKGNPDLKTARIYNADLRYEYYPSNEEYISLSLFYKHFVNPIEQTYIDAGGSYTYTFENARSANNFGVEADIRKNLAFIGLKDFTLGLNAALISSKVKFDHTSSLERDRAMQGQSPYIVNASLYYDNKQFGFSMGLLYNRIGERLVGIGRVDTSSGSSINNDVPDTYELPRDVIDMVLSKKVGKSLEIKFSAKDLLNQSVIFKQYPRFIDTHGDIQERAQISRNFKPGANIFLGLQYSF
jgi:hypothetical protein